MADEDGVVRAWTGLHFAYREMSKLLDERLRAESPCSLSDVDVLNELYCTPEHRLQMLVLAERLRVTRGGLTRIVDRLAASRSARAQPARGLRRGQRRWRARAPPRLHGLRPDAHRDPRRPPGRR